jgi:hypothetical protein
MEAFSVGPDYGPIQQVKPRMLLGKYNHTQEALE